MIGRQIGENLAFINWVVLAGLAVGCFLVAVLARFRTGGTTGYLGFTALSASAWAGLAWLADGGLPATTSAGSPVAPDPAFAGIRSTALLALAGIALVYAVVLLRGRRAPLLATAGTLAGAIALVAGALGWGGEPMGIATLLVQLAILALVTGGAYAAMVLGHWYLVTPKLPEAPLVALSRILLAIVAAQVALFVVSMALGAGIGAGPFGALTGSWALFLWLRLFVGLLFPLVVSWAAVQTARTRSMESATGLLYIDVGAIAAGTILAAGLYFGAGIVA